MIFPWPATGVFFGAIAVAFASFAFPAVESRASNDQPDLAVYAAVEATIRRDYEGMMQNGKLRQFFQYHRDEFRRIVEESPGKAIKGNWIDQIEDADDLIKLMSYNKASIAVECAEKAKLDAAAMTALDSPAYKSDFLPCFEKATGEIAKFLSTDNSYVMSKDSEGKPLFLSIDKFASKCEASARQQAREKALKPYAFLEVKNPATMRLVAFYSYNLCRSLEAYDVAYAAAFPPEKKKK
jgi:hypothetical protein